MQIFKIPLVKLILIPILFTLCINLHASNPEAPYNLRCYDKINPIGTADNPYFGWFINDPDSNEIQSAYQIIVASSITNLNSNIGDIWDSKKVKSRKQNYVYFNGKNLASGTHYFWKVRTWDKDDNVSLYSSAASFSTGLFTNADWSGANWIKRNTQDKDDYTYYRKPITLPNKEIKRAIIYISASHSYEIYLNGKFVAKGFNHHYPQYSYYQAWDITPYLSKNKDNLLGCLTHWYGGGQGRAKGSRGLLTKTIIEYSDSSSTTIVSDKSWKQIQAKQWTPDRPQRNGEGIGRIELIDSRKTNQDWNKLSFDDTDWDQATEIGPHPTEPWIGTLRSDLTRVIEKEIKPKSITQLDNSKYIIDLGKIYAGSFKINYDGGESGDTIKMLGGFVLNEDGTVSKEINQNTKLDSYFIQNGKMAIYNPDVYLGLRYLQVDNSPNKLTTKNVSFITRHYELSKDDIFESSDTTLNKVWDLMVHSLMVGAQEGFVDTPTREKGTFLGDSWAQGVPCMCVLYDRTMNLKSLNEFLDSQDQYWPDGRLNAVYPNVDGGRDIPDFTQAFLIWVWDYYMQTGNIEFLKSNYSRIKKVAEYVSSYMNQTTGLIQNLKGGKNQYEYGIIDWPIDMRYGYDMKTSSRTVINAYAYQDFKIIANIANVLGYNDDKNEYLNKSESLKKAINTHLLNENGVYIDGLYSDNNQSNHISQHANALPYSFGVASDRNTKSIIEEIKNRNMSVGMVSLRWLPEALGKAGEGEQLYHLYTNTKWDGWANTLSRGATVTWESWNALDNNESLSHPWGAVGLLAIQNYFLGIKTISPQADTVLIKPLDFGDHLKFAKGSYKTDKGDIYIDWQNKNSDYSLLVKIPVNIKAKIYIPAGTNTDNWVTIDKKRVKGTRDGDYIFLDIIGSGEHIIERQ